MINYIAWFWAIFPYAACCYWFRKRLEMRERKKVGFFIGLILLILLGVTGCLAVIGDAEALKIFKCYIMLQTAQ